MNREESESNRSHDEINDVMEVLNSTEGDKNSAECDDVDSSIAELKNPSSAVYQIEKCTSIINNGSLKWLRNFDDLTMMI